MYLQQQCRFLKLNVVLHSDLLRNIDVHSIFQHFCSISCVKLLNTLRTNKMSTTLDDGSEPPNKQIRRVTRDSLAKVEREKFLTMPIAEKRKLYKCGSNFVKLKDVSTWTEYFDTSIKGKKAQTSFSSSPIKSEGNYGVDEKLNGKVSIWKGDITKLEIDGIVNAANNSLLGGGGVDGAIHSAAGTLLKQECQTLHGCSTGDVKITAGYNLPAKYVLHTVGPVGENESALNSCYKKCLSLMESYQLTSLAFPCVSTGIYGYPNERAAPLAIESARRYLQHNSYSAKVERIIFCLFLPKDVELYEHFMQVFFPLPSDGADGQGKHDFEGKHSGDKPSQYVMKTVTK